MTEEATPTSEGGTRVEPGEPGEPPSSFWAIGAGHFDLIEIEVATGRELRRVTGWGEALDRPEGVRQALQRVDVAADGWLWVDDCCEPAAGNIFGLDPDRIDDIEEIDVGSTSDGGGRRLTGLNPVVSPDGTLVAYGNYFFDVAVVDRDGASVASLLNDGDGTTFPTPLAWLDPVTLAVARPTSGPSDNEIIVSIWDLTDPSEPVAIGASVTLEGSLVDAAAADDGTVLVLHGPDVFTDPGRQGTAVGPDGSEPFEVQDGMRSIDRASTGGQLLHVGADGLARLGLPGPDVTVLSDIEVVWASW